MAPGILLEACNREMLNPANPELGVWSGGCVLTCVQHGLSGSWVGGSCHPQGNLLINTPRMGFPLHLISPRPHHASAGHLPNKQPARKSSAQALLWEEPQPSPHSQPASPMYKVKGLKALSSGSLHNYGWPRDPLPGIGSEAKAFWKVSWKAFTSL